MTNRDAVNLTAIMRRDGIRQITNYNTGFCVVLIGGGNTTGHGQTVGEALANARDALPQSMAA